MTQKAYKSYLLFSAVFMVVSSLLFTFGAMASTSELTRWTLDLLSWPIDGAQTYSDPTTRFLSAITGGFLFGWGIMVWCLRQWVYDLAPEGVRRSLVAGTIAWFIVDGIGSIMSGNPSNAFFNILSAVVIVGPMWRPAID